jgi:hypothetical protein
MTRYNTLNDKCRLYTLLHILVSLIDLMSVNEIIIIIIVVIIIIIIALK